MNYKKIIVYEYDILFNILVEIKEKINFEIIKANKENFHQIEKYLKEDFLLVSKKPLKNFTNFLLINETPLKIEKLIEQINLKFLKNKFSAQSDINVGLYKFNLNSRVMSKNDIEVSLTEREINLILFLKNSKKPVKIEELQKEVWEYNSELETHTVETHIYRLRKKIKEKFKDENFILSLKDGYLVE
tara:strand:+ start:1045 stop:1608 length:564 start_codon:yes stop_codon:yes gene_type:complete